MGTSGLGWRSVLGRGAGGGEYQLWPHLLACQLPGPQGLEAIGAGPSDVTLPPCPRPLPKHLHTPGSNGRYSTIQCRISHSSLTSLLRDWSSFVLVEGYSYVKLLSRWAEWSLLTRLHPSLQSLPPTPDCLPPSEAHLRQLTRFHFSPVPQTSPHLPSTWSASFPRPLAWFFAWGFQLAHQPRPGIR